MAAKASQNTSENRLSENIGSIILGFVVVLILGGFLLNVFRNNDGEVGDSGDTANDQIAMEEQGNTYTVQPGDTLWLIAERETGSGFNWQAIAEANNLESADAIEEGMELTIPEITDSMAMGEESVTPEPTEAEPTMVVEPTPTVVHQEMTDDTQEAPRAQHGEYTVQHGDNLWKIAVAEYGDGYQWVRIAQANNLDNPNVIHTGNVLQLP